MPQLGSGGGDDLGATDEMLAFKDEGEQEEKIPENAFTERDLADLKSSLVNESEGSGSPAAAAADPEALRRVQDPQRVYQEKLPDHMDDGMKHQDPGMYKGSAYSGYPFLMLSDPYLPNGSMSPLLAINFTSKVLYMPFGHDSSRPNLVFVSYGLAFEPPCQFTTEKVRKDLSTCEHRYSGREAELDRVDLGEQ
ncbi:hypothetical protein DV515_00006942 [Chloebia gouldiae]|uniref:CTNNB1 binding N-teminal domain-containing protein n=1 Tax=Chloebia gouldiae TaxID=44316 RepID=A0A3L8SJ04_CHLGU|nr:hypothetical protein DV515_00006942 [Chloebia gouldiae]